MLDTVQIMMALNTSCEETYTHWVANLESDILRWGLAVTAVVIILATLLFNLAVIVRLKTKSTLKYFTKFFITSLAVADILVGLAVVPFTIYGLFFNSRHIFGDLTCEIANSLDMMFSTSSIFHLLALAFERFIAVCKPLSYNRICDSNTRITLFVLCWAVPAILSFGTLLPKIHLLAMKHISNCFELVSQSCIIVMNLEYAIVTSTIFIFVPMTLILFCNICVCITVRRQGQLRRNMIHNNLSVIYSPESSRSFSREARITATLSIMNGVFIMCWLPFFIVTIINAVLSYKVSGTIFLVCTFLGYANSVANPLVFLISDLRK